MSSPLSPLIENYLREIGFWHVANIGRGCKFDPKLISAFIKRWRPKTHTFHLPCRDCTFTLEVMQLQLGLLVDGSVLTESAQSTDWGAICYDLLGAILDNIYRGRIEMGWWNYSASYVGIPTTLEDIRLLLDQRSEAHVLLINYAIVEMHQMDRVLQKFRFQQPISVTPEVFDDEHKIDLRQSNTH
ncbi:hypothetical protein CXB51_005733 [Gossypium anomalum]|uniref:Aminotransferase-like plant mobile domain-containing protein n=1 Tax=Gossypium anomalum TaxID=47600 RepID=A0A8J6D9Y8_9ROSI|nr:hypothetical protein CXB51_005733 [Gossypium anomalum]